LAARRLDMANDRYPMRERDPMSDEDDLGRTTEEDIVGETADEEFEDIDEIEDDEELDA
jgi:hypothetical protein